MTELIIHRKSSHPLSDVAHRVAPNSVASVDPFAYTALKGWPSSCASPKHESNAIECLLGC